MRRCIVVAYSLLRSKSNLGLVLDSVFERHWLTIAATIAIDRDTLYIEIDGEFVNLSHIFDRRFVREVNGLADGRIAVSLESRLHFHMPIWCDVVSADKDFLHFFWDAFDVLQASLLCDLANQLFRVEALLLRHLDEHFIRFAKRFAVEHLTIEGERKHRFNSARAIRDNRNRSRRRDRRRVRIANSDSCLLPIAAFPCWKNASLFGEFF